MFEAGYQEVSLLPIDGVQKMGFTVIADNDQIDRSLRPLIAKLVHIDVPWAPRSSRPMRSQARA